MNPKQDQQINLADEAVHAALDNLIKAMKAAKVPYISGQKLADNVACFFEIEIKKP